MASPSPAWFQLWAVRPGHASPTCRAPLRKAAPPGKIFSIFTMGCTLDSMPPEMLMPSDGEKHCVRVQPDPKMQAPWRNLESHPQTQGPNFSHIPTFCYYSNLNSFQNPPEPSPSNLDPIQIHPNTPDSLLFIF